MERATDSFSLVSEYFGRCLFDDLSTFENQLPKFKQSAPVVLAPKLVVPAVQYQPKLTPSTNPFDEDHDDDNDDQMKYDDNKNPFKDDYDESKNPFADDM